MEWPANLRPVRDVVFECLKLPEARNKYFSSTQLANLCNIAAGVQALHGIDKAKIGRAFSNGNVSDYRIEINDLLTDDLDSAGFLHVYISGSIKDISDHSRTGVAVDRRNARMNIHSIFTRPTNTAAKQQFPNVNQIESAAASAHYLDSIKKLNTKIAQAKSHFGIDKCIAFRNRYNDPLVLQSTIQQRQKLDQFSATLPTCNFDVAYKAEKAGQVDLTCAMGGLILISKLTVKSGNLPDIIAELKARGVSKKKYKDKNISALKELLRKSEAQRIIDEEPTKENKPWDKITTIKPKSDALKALLQTYVIAADNNNENEEANVP